jgi:hypothetical protein
MAAACKRRLFMTTRTALIWTYCVIFLSACFSLWIWGFKYLRGPKP